MSQLSPRGNLTPQNHWRRCYKLNTSSHAYNNTINKKARITPVRVSRTAGWNAYGVSVEGTLLV